MADITAPPPQGRQIIRAYGDGGFRISEQRWEGAVLVLPERTLALPVAGVRDITAEILAPLAAAEPPIDVLLIGCGASIAFVGQELRRAVRAWGPVIEPMDTGAACRTYNVLALEDRRVAAALLPVG
jgi:uncharacterized protein